MKLSVSNNIIENPRPLCVDSIPFANESSMPLPVLGMYPPPTVGFLNAKKCDKTATNSPILIVNINLILPHFDPKLSCLGLEKPR